MAKKIHWTKTPEGKRKLRRIALNRWKKRDGWRNRNHATTASTKKTAKRKATKRKSAVQFIGGDFLRKALEEAAHEVSQRVDTAVRKALEGFANPVCTTPPEYQWTMGNGEQIKPSDMQESHLRNAISFCTRRLISRLSESVWVHDTFTYLEGLTEMLKEAKKRDIKV